MRIRCAGRWADGKYKCEWGFVHTGEWNDKKLKEHQKVEESEDNKYDFWLGFKEVKKRKKK